MLPTLPATAEYSVYTRNTLPLVAGTPAVASVKSAGLNENISKDTGAVPPPSGTTLTEPMEVTAADPEVLTFCELRGATE